MVSLGAGMRKIGKVDRFIMEMANLRRRQAETFWEHWPPILLGLGWLCVFLFVLIPLAFSKIPVPEHRAPEPELDVLGILTLIVLSLLLVSFMLGGSFGIAALIFYLSRNITGTDVKLFFRKLYSLGARVTKPSRMVVVTSPNGIPLVLSISPILLTLLIILVALVVFFTVFLLVVQVRPSIARMALEGRIEKTRQLLVDLEQRKQELQTIVDGNSETVRATYSFEIRTLKQLLFSSCWLAPLIVGILSSLAAEGIIILALRVFRRNNCPKE